MSSRARVASRLSSARSAASRSSPAEPPAAAASSPSSSAPATTISAIPQWVNSRCDAFLDQGREHSHELENTHREHRHACFLLSSTTCEA